MLNHAGAAMILLEACASTTTAAQAGHESYQQRCQEAKATNRGARPRKLQTEVPGGCKRGRLKGAQSGAVEEDVRTWMSWEGVRKAE